MGEEQVVEEIKQPNIFRLLKMRKIRYWIFAFMRKRKSKGLALIFGNDDIIRSYTIDLKDSFTVKEDVYGISKKCIYKSNGIPVILYNEGSFDPVKINSSDNRTVSSKVMKDLFRQARMSGQLDNNLQLLLILVCACGVGLLVVMSLLGKL